MKDIFDVTDKIAVVTGGLGQLGRRFTIGLAERGARVAVFNRKLPAEAELAARFPLETGRIAFFKADVTNRASLVVAMEDMETKWGVPSILVNNAGIDTPPGAPPSMTGPFETFPEEVWDEVIDVNLKGAMLCAQVVGGAMARAGRGSVINVGSIYGSVSPVQPIYEFMTKARGEPFIKPVAYCASKSGILNLTRYLATYWAPKGVRVNTVTFGGVFREGQDPQFIANFTERVPMGRQAREEEYVGVIVFLGSDASSYMTGANLVMDGGWTAW